MVFPTVEIRDQTDTESFLRVSHILFLGTGAGYTCVSVGENLSVYARSMWMLCFNNIYIKRGKKAQKDHNKKVGSFQSPDNWWSSLPKVWQVGTVVGHEALRSGQRDTFPMRVGSHLASHLSNVSSRRKTFLCSENHWIPNRENDAQHISCSVNICYINEWIESYPLHLTDMETEVHRETGLSQVTQLVMGRSKSATLSPRVSARMICLPFSHGA